ncbi:BTB domain-containing protein [Mycena sanguinolenta]|uniref:BTB domain-containing protein n=1 Tax=Mycena sanguinolenta TaxID=230812 RepID=A0A8H6ZAS9_9AGAR|nr:BTB domain-containing protein [Mycena sanguinolenta]
MDSEKPIPVADLCFSDGTVVILVENKMFRVHKSILAARSSVFRDMFEDQESENSTVGFVDRGSAYFTFLTTILGKLLPTAEPKTSEMDVVEGYPVVRLHHSADDFEVFLRAIFDSSTFMPWLSSPRPHAAVIAAIFRLSHMYKIRYLYLRAMEHLYAYRHVSARPWRFNKYWLPGYDNLNPQELLVIIKAVMDVGAVWLLPGAYYHAFVVGAHLLPCPANSGDESILHTLRVGSHNIMSQTAKMSSFLALSCTSARHKYLADLLEALSKGVVSPTHYHERWVDRGKSTLCDPCFQATLLAYDAAMLEFWEKLPQHFGLPSWADLNRMSENF